MSDQPMPRGPGRGRRGDGPDPIDIHVGSRIRLRRKMLRLSQEKLGAALGLTFQQVQKYERGTNRAGASRLHELSKILDVPISFSFDDEDPVRAPAVPTGFAEDVAEAYRPDPMKPRGSTGSCSSRGSETPRLPAGGPRRSICHLRSQAADLAGEPVRDRQRRKP